MPGHSRNIRRRFTLAVLALAGAAASVAILPAYAATNYTPSSSWGTERTDLAAQVVELVNQHRASKGLSALSLSPTLTVASRWKSLHQPGTATSATTTRCLLSRAPSTSAPRTATSTAPAGARTSPGDTRACRPSRAGGQLERASRELRERLLYDDRRASPRTQAGGCTGRRTSGTTPTRTRHRLHLHRPATRRSPRRLRRSPPRA